MTMTAVLESLDLLDSATVDGQQVVDALRAGGVTDVEVKRFTGREGSTDFVRAAIPGTRGRRAGGDAPTLGIVGRLGGIGARPQKIGLVSDGDGAVTAIACALKLGRMIAKGDRLPGDVLISTHVCPNAPTMEHPVVTMMNSPVDMATLNAEEVRPEMEAVVTVDTTRGNRVVNHRGIAISPTVMQGWILRVADDLLTIQQHVTGRMPVVLPITMQDITPYGNELFHVNSILQPCVATDAPVVGVALTAEVAVPGSATGASHAVDVELATRFCLEVAKAFGQGKCRFYDGEEWQRIQRRYGSMKLLQTPGKG
jgi:hypothetical protein